VERGVTFVYAKNTESVPINMVFNSLEWGLSQPLQPLLLQKRGCQKKKKIGIGSGGLNASLPVDVRTKADVNYLR
jgi:hypothetical protein